MNFTKTFKLAAPVFGLVFLLASCHDLEAPAAKASDFDSKSQTEWVKVFTEVERYAPGYRPGPAPRALFYLSYSAYEALIPGMPENNSLAATMPGGLILPQTDGGEFHWPTVVNASWAFLMKKFFFHMASGPNSNEFAKIESKKNELNSIYKSQTTDEIFNRSVQRGEAIASAIYDWSKTDGGHDVFLDPFMLPYSPPTGPGLWQPTFPDFTPAMFPKWGSVRPIAMHQTDLVCPAPPISWSEDPNSAFYSQALEVRNRVNNIKSNGPGAYEDLWISEFWSDDILGQTFSPPTRSFMIAMQVVDNEKSTLDVSTDLFAKLGAAGFDYSIACWRSKYVYNLERPASYIRRNMEPNWTSALNNVAKNVKGITPAFPAYPSGHSGFGSASTSVLASVYGEFYSMTDRCHENRVEFNGKPRSFKNFSAMGWEDALSRVPLGVHFRIDCEAGVYLGQLAAERTLELPWKK